MNSYDSQELSADVNLYIQQVNDFSSNYLRLLDNAAQNTLQGEGLSQQQLAALQQQAGANKLRDMAAGFGSKAEATGISKAAAAWRDAEARANDLANGLMDPRVGSWDTFASNTRWTFENLGKVARPLDIGMTLADGTSAAIAGDWRRVSEVNAEIASGCAASALGAYFVAGLMASGPIPLYTNEHCFFEWETKARGKVKKHLPADGSAYLVRVDELHRGANYSPENAERIHFLLSLEEAPSPHLIDEDFVELTVDSGSPKSESGNDLWHSRDIEKLCSSRSSRDVWQATQVIMTARKQVNGIYFAKGNPEHDAKYIVDNDSRSIICEAKSYQYLKPKTEKPVYPVENLFETARAFADHARARFQGKVIGITGSVGKTTIKDGLVSVLSAISQVHASKGNQNADWGLLETISNTPANADYAVYELGMLGRKSIGLKSRRVKPHVAVITNVFDAHRSFHSSDESIAETKAEILEGLSEGGIAVLPADSPWYKLLRAKAKTYESLEVLTFGESENSDIRLMSFDCSSSGTELVVSIFGDENRFVTSLLGRQAAMNCTILISIMYALGLDPSATKDVLKRLRPSRHRGEIFPATCAEGSFTVIDDTWNASPASVVAAINNMKFLKLAGGGRKILFLGDMLQLGKNERQKHVELVGAITANGIDKVFTVGELSKSLFQALPVALGGEHFSDALTAAEKAKGFVASGDVVLVKGSHAMEMWRVVRALREKSVPQDMAGTPLPTERCEGKAI